MDYRSRYCFWLPLVVRYVTRLFFSSLPSWIQIRRNAISGLSGYISTAEWHHQGIPSHQAFRQTTRRDITIQPTQSRHYTIQQSFTQYSRNRKTEGEIEREKKHNKKTDKRTFTYRLPRSRRPPPRSLLRQARGPACCCHGSGLKLSRFRQHRYHWKEGKHMYKQRYGMLEAGKQMAMQMRCF
jgi:hypothetical protein